jgi:tRNA A-37 threonylcarbamoyl transferase component Bud32
MSLQAGQVIEGKYRIVRLLGEGGMGAVYEGENVRIHRRVAIKVLHAGVAENLDAVQRFEREAQAAGRIGSDHIVEVIDLGNLPDGDRFMVMEYLDGESFSQRIHGRGRLPPAEAAGIMVQLLEGLAAAHGAGIFHRDLKPDNVYLLRSKKGQGDFVKILDFGISKFNKLNKDSGMSMTRTGAVMGTPYYMSPEQAKGSKEMDHRSDLYSAGVMLYEAITGQVPFNAETFNELIFKIVLETAPPPQQLAPGLDPAFSSIMQKAMAREPNDRFQTAQEFAGAMQAWLGTGQGVALPPQQMPAQRAVMGSAPMLGQTPAPWANTGGPGHMQTTAGLPRKRSAVPIVMSFLALATVGVGGGVLYKVLGKGSAPEQVVAPTALVTPSPVPAAAPHETAKVESAPKPPEPAAPEPASAASTAAIGAAPAAAAPAAAAPALKRPVTFGGPPIKRPLDKPSSPVAATPVAPPPPAPPPPAPTSTGRKIRTEL